MGSSCKSGKAIELKLAWDLSARSLEGYRRRPGVDKNSKLDADFASKLDPYVRTKYLELEEAVEK